MIEAEIETIEFLGAYCLVQVRGDELGGQSLTVTLSPNFLAERGLGVGARLPMRLLADRMRLF